MNYFRGISFTRVVVVLVMHVFLAVHTDCRPAANVPGTVTTTRAKNFRWFFERVANPCEVIPMSGSTAQVPTSTTIPTISSSDRDLPTIDFYHSIESALKESLQNLQMLESADPSLPECNGISLDSLPVTPFLDNMNDGETIKQAYKSIIYLTTHFHLISTDRQIPTTGENVQLSDQQIEPESGLPLWRFQRCGNETENFPSILIDVTTSLENILCTILSSATAEQTQSFREPLNSLQETILYRYHTSCSTLQTRDCLVVREAKQALGLISRKYSQLIQQQYNAGGSSVGSNTIDDDIDNSI